MPDLLAGAREFIDSAKESEYFPIDSKLRMEYAQAKIWLDIAISLRQLSGRPTDIEVYDAEVPPHDLPAGTVPMHCPECGEVLFGQDVEDAVALVSAHAKEAHP